MLIVIPHTNKETPSRHGISFYVFVLLVQEVLNFASQGQPSVLLKIENLLVDRKIGYGKATFFNHINSRPDIILPIFNLLLPGICEVEIGGKTSGIGECYTVGQIKI